MTPHREARAALERHIDRWEVCATCNSGFPDDCETFWSLVDALVTAARREELAEREAILDRAWRLVADDAWAMTFQTLGQYREAVMEFLADEARAARIRARGETHAAR